MSDQYAEAIKGATVALAKGMRKAPTAEQRDMWKAMLERLACIEAMDGPTK